MGSLEHVNLLTDCQWENFNQVCFMFATCDDMSVGDITTKKTYLGHQNENITKIG